MSSEKFRLISQRGIVFVASLIPVSASLQVPKLGLQVPIAVSSDNSAAAGARTSRKYGHGSSNFEIGRGKRIRSSNQVVGDPTDGRLWMFHNVVGNRSSSAMFMDLLSGKFIRRSRFWKRGSGRSVSNRGSTLRRVTKGARSSIALSNERNASSFSPKPA